jgi:phosphoribosylformylglycinamidine synthase
MKIKVIVTLKEGVLDPQGQAILRSIHKLGHRQVASVRQGKFFELEIENQSRAEALELSRKLADSVLSNPIIESFEVEESS